jgi:hypothetical protein
LIVRGGATVEGVNLGGIFLGYLAALVFGGTSLMAVGLLIARLTKAALVVFASGLLCATVIAALAALSFLRREFNQEGSGAMIVLAALTLLLAGAGQFVAALRSPRCYAAAFGCAAGSIVYGAVAGLGGGDALPWKLPAGPGVSLLLAAASMMIAVLLPLGSRQRETADDFFARLHAAGWSVGDVRQLTPAGPRWLVSGTNGDVDQPYCLLRR